MGEIADDIADGACCGLCSSYFEHDHGHPVLCGDCWDTSSAEERKGWQKAIHPEVMSE